jgi:hypothetical protein
MSIRRLNPLLIRLIETPSFSRISPILAVRQFHNSVISEKDKSFKDAPAGPRKSKFASSEEKATKFRTEEEKAKLRKEREERELKKKAIHDRQLEIQKKRDQEKAVKNTRKLHNQSGRD